MSDMIDFSTPLAGMQGAEARLETAASHIAVSSLPADNVDLSREMTAMLQARNDFAANVKTAVLEDDITRSTLSIIG